MKDIISFVKTNFETIDVLLDTYGSFNFELLRTAYTLGCEFKQYSNVIINNNKQNL